MLKITTRRVLDEFDRRGITYEIITEAPHALVRYRHAGGWHLLHSTMPEYTSGSGKIICDQKLVATTLATLYDIPVPTTEDYSGMDAAREFLARHGDIVVKPADGAHGNGITVSVTAEGLQAAVDLALVAAGAGGVLLQKRVTGSDLRVLVIGGRFAAASRRVPASVTGDGTSTVRQLIEQENATNPERGTNDEKRLSIISLQASERYLGGKLDSLVPAAGEQLTVVGTANIGAGGHAVDYTDILTPEIIADAEKFARLVRVAACGVDFIWDEDAGKHYFIEGNACPGMNLHIEPAEGTPRRTDALFVDFLLEQHDGGSWSEREAAAPAA